MKDKRFQSLTYDNAIKQYVYDRNNDTTSLDVMLKLLEKFDDSVVVDYLANPTGWEERFAKVLEQSGIWDSFAKEFAEPLWHIWFRPGNIWMRSARTLLAGKASVRI